MRSPKAPVIHNISTNSGSKQGMMWKVDRGSPPRSGPVNGRHAGAGARQRNEVMTVSEPFILYEF